MLRMSVCLLMVSMLLTGCAEWVNIPAVPGDVARHDPNLGDVADVEVAALSALMTRYPTQSTTQVILPMGTSDATYNRVVQSIGQGAVMGDASAATSLEVMAIRIRVTEAWVDIRKFTESRIPQLYTVYLKNDVISGWYMQRIRPWRGTINEGDHVPAKLQEERALYRSEVSQPAAPDAVAMPRPVVRSEPAPTRTAAPMPTQPQRSTTTTTTTTTSERVIVTNDEPSSMTASQTTIRTSTPAATPLDSEDVQVQSGGIVEITE